MMWSGRQCSFQHWERRSHALPSKWPLIGVPCRWHYTVYKIIIMDVIYFGGHCKRVSMFNAISLRRGGHHHGWRCCRRSCRRRHFNSFSSPEFTVTTASVFLIRSSRQNRRRFYTDFVKANLADKMFRIFSRTRSTKRRKGNGSSSRNTFTNALYTIDHGIVDVILCEHGEGTPTARRFAAMQGVHLPQTGEVLMVQ